MRAALESYFMIKGPQNKLTASCLLKNKQTNTENKAASNDYVFNTFSDPRPGRGAING